MVGAYPAGPTARLAGRHVRLPAQGGGGSRSARCRGVALLGLALAAAALAPPAVAEWRYPAGSMVHGRVGELGTPGADITRRGSDLVLALRPGKGLTPDGYSVAVLNSGGGRRVLCRRVTADQCVDSAAPAATERRYVVIAHRGRYWTRSSRVLHALTPPPGPVLALASTAPAEATRVRVVARPGADAYTLTLSVDGASVEGHRWTVSPESVEARTISLPALSRANHVIRAIADFDGISVSSDPLTVSAAAGSAATSETAPAPVSRGATPNPSEVEPGTLADVNQNGVVDAGDVLVPVSGKTLRPRDLCSLQSDSSGATSADASTTDGGTSRTQPPGQPLRVAVSLVAGDEARPSGARKVHVALTSKAGSCPNTPATIDLGEVTLTAVLPTAQAMFDDSRLALGEAAGAVTLTLGANVAGHTSAHGSGGAAMPPSMSGAPTS